MNSSSFCSAIWLAGLKRKSALSANCSGWRPLQGMESRAPLDNFSPLIFTALPRSAQSTRSSWNIKSRFIQFGFANLLLAYQPLPQSLQATWSREHYAIFFLFSSSHQPDSPPESDEFRARHFQVIAGMFLRMRAFFTSSFVEPHQIRTWQEPSETWVTLCYVSMHTLHTLTCASLYSSSSFLLKSFRCRSGWKHFSWVDWKTAAIICLHSKGALPVHLSVAIGILWLIISCPCHWVIILKWVSRCGIAVSKWGKQQNRAIHNRPKPCHIRLQPCPLDTCCALLPLPAATSISTAQSLLLKATASPIWFSLSRTKLLAAVLHEKTAAVKPSAFLWTVSHLYAVTEVTHYSLQRTFPPPSSAGTMHGRENNSDESCSCLLLVSTH